MSDFLERTEVLVGKNGIENLKNSYIAVFGLGGVGGHAIDALARAGIGCFDLIDKDKFETSNINRQIFANINTVGKYKTEVAKAHILSINPNAQVNVYNEFYLKDNADMFDFSKYDYVLDAVDTVTAKLIISEKCNLNSTKLISVMGTGNKLDPTAFEVADIYETSVCPLAKIMRKELKQRNIHKLKVVYSKEPPIFLEKSNNNIIGSTSFVPSVAGLIAAGEIIKELANPQF